MRIGRDHLASTVYTLVFAYVGGAMPVLLLLTVFARPWADVITSEDVATEVVRTLCSAFGLILAIPLTTAVAVAVAAPREERPAPVMRRRPDPGVQGGAPSSTERGQRATTSKGTVAWTSGWSRTSAW